MADTIIQSLRDYFLTCPLMGDSAINVDYLPEGPEVEYSIDTTPDVYKRQARSPKASGTTTLTAYTAGAPRKALGLWNTVINGCKAWTASG